MIRKLNPFAGDSSRRCSISDIIINQEYFSTCNRYTDEVCGWVPIAFTGALLYLYVSAASVCVFGHSHCTLMRCIPLQQQSLRRKVRNSSVLKAGGWMELLNQFDHNHDGFLDFGDFFEVLLCSFVSVIFRPGCGLNISSLCSDSFS